MSLTATFAYHERTKHHPFRYAASLGYMDWATQPDPFRRFHGAGLVPLALVPPGDEPRYDAALAPGGIAAAPLDHRSISQLFHDALALSAWKEAGGARWSLRVNPSSGNLHPTEGYLIAGPVAGVHHRPAVYHYAPFEHALERRVELSDSAWASLASQLPVGAVLVGLTSIHWRESWKYGERAFRYCQHDAGHAVASVAMAAAGLGWQARLLEGVTDAELAVLLGVQTQTGVEAEHADCLLAVFPAHAAFLLVGQLAFMVPGTVVDELVHAGWSGAPNRLSRTHHEWPAIDEVTIATGKRSPPDVSVWSAPAADDTPRLLDLSAVGLRRIIHQRRSALAFDGETALTRDGFYHVLLQVVPGARAVPFTALPWRPEVDLLLFVHRVQDLDPGLYVLLRDPTRREALEAAMEGGRSWVSPDGCPSSLPLYVLQAGDARPAARQTSCHQDIAADGIFLAAMLAGYRPALERFGPWFYRRLHWETGAIGQVLYLEAEAIGIRSTGIGCFFDDLTHRLFGLGTDRFQVLYHFTMGGPVDDPRVRTIAPYEHLA